MIRKLLPRFGRATKNPTHVGVAFEASVIAIAGDSQIDVVDIFPHGDIRLSDRIRVSVNRPYLGAPLDLRNALLMPVRYSNQSTTANEPDDYSTSLDAFERVSTWPYLTLELWGPGEHPCSMAMERAPAEYAYSQNAGTSSVLETPSYGRRRWDYVADAAGTTVTLAIDGVDFHVAEGDFSVTEIVTVLRASAAVTTPSDVSFEYEGAPFDAIRITWGAASGLNYESKLRLYDW